MSQQNQVISYISEVEKLTPIIEEQVKLLTKFAEANTKAYALLPSDYVKQQKEQIKLEQENEKLQQQSIKTRQQLEALSRQQIQTNSASLRLSAQQNKEFDRSNQQALKTKKLIEDADNRLIKVAKDKESQDRKNLKLHNDFYDAMESQKNKQIQSDKKIEESNNKLIKAELKAAKEKEAQDAKRMKSHNDFYNAIERQKKQQSQINKQLEQENSAYIQLQNKWRLAQRALADLATSQGVNAEATKKARIEFEKLDKQIRTVDNITKNYSKNVGNYASAFAGGFSQMVSAFGFVGAITTGIAVLKDAFNITKAYEAEIVNLGAIAGKTRDQLGNLENVIRNTAKTSLNTATDVAKVATELIKLGSSTEEAEKLIPTVNNLSIALRSSAEETAELLKSSLNAFGEGASEAKRYGDVIAGMANKSALDFARIRDAMSYIAPVAKALGYNLEETGALIGVLVDNGIKAESAGRLLRTAMIKLQGQGLTLNQALEKIKNSTDKTTVAYNLMGAEASTLGVVLANNTDKLAKLNSELKDSKGELQELADKQLSSLDSKLKLLTSSWQELILTIENGNGVVSKWIKNWVDGTTIIIDKIGVLISSFDDLAKKAQETQSSLSFEVTSENIGGDYNTNADKRKGFDTYYSLQQKQESETIDKIKAKRKELEESSSVLKDIGLAFLGQQNKEPERIKGELIELKKELGDIQGTMQAINNAREGYNNRNKNSGGTETNTELTDKEKKAREKAIEEARKLAEEKAKITYQSNQLEATELVEHNYRIASINAKNSDEQFQADINYIEAKKELLKTSYAEEIRLANGNAEQLRLAKIKNESELQKLEDESLKIAIKNSEELAQKMQQLESIQAKNNIDNANRDVMLSAKTSSQKLQARLKYIQDQKSLLDVEREKELDNAKNTTADLLLIQEDYSQRKIELNNQANELIADNARKNAEAIEQFINGVDFSQFGLRSLNVFTQITDDGKSAFIEAIKNAETWQQKMGSIVGAVGTLFQDLYAMFEGNSQARFDAEMSRLEISRDVEIQFAGDSVSAREEIDRQFEEKRRELQKKKAEDEKKAAMFGAFINVAMGVTSALAQAPPYSFILAGLVAAAGAIQIASIASTPIPEFWMGTDNAPEGWALTQERGAEVITDKNNNVKTMGHNKGASLTYLNAGDKVYKSQNDFFNSELDSLLSSNGISYNVEVNNGVTAEEMDFMLAKHIASQSQKNIIFDEKGFTKAITKRNNRQIIKNNAVKF